LLLNAFVLAERQHAVPLALRAALTILRRKGCSLENPERDARTWDLLNGITLVSSEPHWPVRALEDARAVLNAAGISADGAPSLSAVGYSATTDPVTN
jgi:hypothetical protein